MNKTISTFYKQAANYPQGKVIKLQHESAILKDNPWGDPISRTIYVYLPPDYDEPNRRFITLWDLVGYTGSGPAHVNWQAFQESLPQRVDRLIAEEKMGSVIVVFPDCFTTLGGNQYINSSAIGNYADYLTLELIPFIDNELKTIPAREKRGVFGKSSGGYAAMVHGMKYSQYWGAIASHSGDAYFDFVYRMDFPNVINTLAKEKGDILKFIKKFWKSPRPTSAQVHALMTICMAASYDPDPSAEIGFHLPFDLHTGELDQEHWAKWLQHDPIYLVEQYAEQLKTLKGIYMDCGFRDQYHIHYGSRILANKLTDLNIEHLYEEFDGTHSGVDYRMDQSLPFLYEKLMNE